MKEVIMYECEHCKDAYRTKEEAMNCEKIGKEIPLAKKGQLVSCEVRVGGGFSPFFVEMRVAEVKHTGHFCVYEMEEYDEEDGKWYESSYASNGIWGNGTFNKLCTIKK